MCVCVCVCVCVCEREREREIGREKGRESVSVRSVCLYVHVTNNRQIDVTEILPGLCQLLYS